jgi:general secretion pathway protein A
MSYYKVLGLEEEPFSTSPDPAFFYESIEHKEAHLRLEIAVKLKRGLSVILGDVGSGKTTLARKLFGQFSDNAQYEFCMILDPTANTEQEFLSLLADAFEIPIEQSSSFGFKKALERRIFQQGIDENKTVILLIDESQKLTHHALEVLRTLLNYETNKYKLLQLVLFGQMELLPQIKGIKNFWDRIALKYVINPLNPKEARELIMYRLKQAGYKQRIPLFNSEAMQVIYDYTKGYPRQITMVCHNALEMLILRNKEVVDREIIEELIDEEAEVLQCCP